ncbi:MAG: hypothetical protein K2K97_11530 [Muribaculaceae bacterium]|nr:hypothetical protein [Muribaculaceae bacterium]
MTKSPLIPMFGEIVGDPRIKPVLEGAPKVALSPVGRIVDEELSLITDQKPMIEVKDWIVMPDHIHFIVFVKCKLGRHLGCELAVFKKTCTQRVHFLLHPEASQQNSIGNKVSVFEQNYNDTIALRNGQIDTMKQYIANNPRRRAIIREYPDFFTRHISIKTSTQNFIGFGNTFLLHIPNKVAVKVRSFWTDEEFQSKKQEWLKAVKNGAILISPFYSRREKEVKDAALALGGSVIIMRNIGFPDKFKPSGREFDLCSEGRLLLLAEHDAPLYRKQLERSDALRLNDHCVMLARIDSSAMEISVRRLGYGQK